MTELPTAAAFWEARYTEADHIWSGNVNRALADVVAELVPGRALDLGCGEGGDAIWLAQHGWTVTGVDLSPTAVARGNAAAAQAGVPDGAVRLQAADLTRWVPPEGDGDDLVCASFLHSWPVAIPREDILRRATGFVAPGGHMLVIAHAAAPSWVDPESMHGHAFPQPDEDLAALNLDADRWEVRICETRDRDGIAPDGTPATFADGVVLVRRLR